MVSVKIGKKFLCDIHGLYKASSMEIAIVLPELEVRLRIPVYIF